MAIVMCIAMIGSAFAWFTDSDSSASNTFTAGTLKINDTAYSDFVFEFDNMAPGDITDDYEILIENDGTLPLAWFGDWKVGSSILRNAIYLDYAEMQFLNKAGESNSWETDDNFILNGVGNPPSGAWYNSLVTTPFNVITLDSWEDNSSMAPISGYEHMGALNPGYAYKLIVRFGFAPGAGNEYQGAGPLTVRFHIDATQINADALNALQSGLGNHVDWMEAQIAKQQ